MKKKRKWLIGGSVLIVAVVLLVVFSMGGEQVVETARVEQGDLVQEVSVTGVVEPKEEVNLAFQQGGILESLPFSVGDQIESGDVVATQESSELEASLREAQASVRVEEARLSSLKGGNRAQEISIKETELENAETDLTNLYDETPTIIQDVQNDVDKVLNDDIDALFEDDNTSDPELTFFITSQSVEFTTEQKRLNATQAHNKITSIKNSVQSESVSPETALPMVLSELRTIEDFLNSLGEALNYAAGVSQTTLATYKTDTNTARSSINMAITTVEEQTQSIATTKLAIQKLKQQLDLLVEGTRVEDIVAQEAALEKAQATRDRIYAQLQKTVLRSPIAGVVTKINADVGEAIQGSSPVVSVISQGDFEIITRIPEADIVMVTVGDMARVTLDALSDEEIFTARVVAIDPAETTIEGVATYKVTLIFDDDRGVIRSGMTANVDIETDRKENALYVPSRAIERRDGNEYVRIMQGQLIVEREVITGIRDVFGNVEIKEGLSLGQEVVTFLPDSR